MSDEPEITRSDAAPEGGDDCHYGSYYYENCCGLPYRRSADWLNLFRRFADRIADEIAPGSMLDAGCAMGFLVEALRERDVDAYGIDISSYAIANVGESVRDRCRVGSVMEPFGRRYDLIVSIEVLEHLQPRDAEMAVENFCAHADDIILSSTPFDYKEASHFNVQPPEYWAELFARQGFYRDLDYDASYITRWATRFRKIKMPAPRIVANYERKHWRLLQENLGARESLMEHQDKLIAAETGLARVTARNEQLEADYRDFGLQMAERHAAEAAISMEFHRSVQAWSDHVKHLDEHIRHAADEYRHLLGQFEARERYVKETEAWGAGEHEAHKATQRSLDEARNQLAEMHSSRAWKLATRLSRLKTRLAPIGSLRRKALKAVVSLGKRRPDPGHSHSPTNTRKSETVSDWSELTSGRR